MKITVMGAGYVGLVTAACLAEVGNEVLCLDLDAARIATLKDGILPLYEPGLQDLMRKNCAARRLQFGGDTAAAVGFGQVQFIAVGTPAAADGSADLQQVLAAAHSVGRYMTEDKLVVVKSTVPPGTAARVKSAIAQALAARGKCLTVSVSSNPEFLKAGAAVEDFMRPDRIVIGTDDVQATARLRELYAPFQRNHERLLVMDVASAELTKYAANAMLATRISFMNELANLAETQGADIELVRRGMGADLRIGYDYLYAGTGYGGSCFPKDLHALLRTAQQAGVSLRVLQAVQDANDAQKQVLVDRLVERFGTDLRGKRFALWGLSFKPNTDDMREAPSRVIMERLWDLGAVVQAYDPVAMGEARRLYGERSDLEFASSPMEALEGADGLLIATEWRPFKSPDFAQMKQLMRCPVVLDGRNLYDPARLRAAGMDYFSVGRGWA
jgi:UDPglucose 6-dehydrogenase